MKIKILEDMKKYMKEKDTDALDAVRMLRSDIKNTEIDKKSDLSNNDILKIVQSTINKNKEAADIFEQAGRSDLSDQQNSYIKALAKYMPEQLSEEQILNVVKEVASSVGGSDKANFGQLMKETIDKVGVQADGKTVSALVKKFLGK